MANVPIHSMTDLWNSGGTTYYGIKMDVTNSASAAGSKLFAMQIASVNIFDVDKSGDVTLTSVDAGATAGPILNLSRISSSPAASDLIGSINFNGEDSAGNTDTYAKIFSTITDPTSTSEDASLTFQNVVAGSLTTQAVITATGWNSMNIGATTAGTGRFTTLTATGAVTFTSGSITGVALNGTLGATTPSSVVATSVASPLYDSTTTTWLAATSAAGTMIFRPNGSGSATGQVTINSSGTINAVRVDGAFNGTLGATTPAAAAVTTLAASGQVTLGSYVVRTIDNDEMRLSGGTLTDGSDGPLLRMFGANRAGLENDYWFQVGSNQVYQYDHSALSHLFRSSGTTRATITTTGLNDTAIGATTPNTGAFTNLTTSGNVNFNSTGVNTVTITSTDAGASTGPLVILYRDSASAAASDTIGSFRFNGNDATGTSTIYCDIYVSIADATNGSEDGTVTFRNIVAGALTAQAQITATGWNSMNIGATTAGTGRFTTLAATSTLAVTGQVELGTLSLTGASAGTRWATSGTISTSTAVATGAGSTATHLAIYNQSGLTGSITSSFNVTTYATTSDERKKDFIGFLDPQVAIEMIRADPAREWNWKDNGVHDVGWGAQTSKKVNPSFATYLEDQDAWVMDKAGPRTPYLWAALAGALDKIDALEARLAALEAA